MSAKPPQRIIRLFISSTFRDMYLEREDLVKRVFPQIRQLCEKRKVIWREVDLRWGISDDEARDGKILPICLAEVANCRPYFIGILGNRYGWIPDHIPEHLLEEQPWLRDHAGKSITELEILSGALINQVDPRNVFFYFRDPQYLLHLPEGDAVQDFQEECPGSQKKLSDLKQTIRDSGLPVRQYAETPALGDLVLSDLKRLVETLFPEETFSNVLEQEIAAHELFAESYSQSYIGGETYFAVLDRHMEDKGTPLVIVGDAGVGKSALLAAWAQRRIGPHSRLTQQADRPNWIHPIRRLKARAGPENKPVEQVLITHFIGATPESTDWSAIVRRIMQEINEKFALAHKIPDEVGHLKIAFASCLHAAVKRATILLIIDGLDQLEGAGNGFELDWLPVKLPHNVRLVLSSADDSQVEAFRKRKWRLLKLEPLGIKDRARFITGYLGQYRKRISPHSAQRIFAATPTANPLYLKLLLEELRLFGHHELLQDRIDHYLSAKTTEALYMSILARFEEDYEHHRLGLVGDAMRLIWAARHGISENELLELLGNAGKPLPQAIWSPLYVAARESLVSKSGLLSFFHKDLRRAVEARYLPEQSQKNSAHRRLCNYFAGRPLSYRQLDELPWQLVTVEAWQELYALLADPQFLIAAWPTRQIEVKSNWLLIERKSSLRLIDAYRRVIDQPHEYEEALMPVAILLADTGHIDIALDLVAHLEAKARRQGCPEELQASLSLKGTFLKNSGKLDQALALFIEQESISRTAQSPAALAASLGNQGVILREKGRPGEALTLFQQEEIICRASEDLAGLGANLGNQGIVLHDLNDPDRSLTLFREQEKIYRQLGEAVGLGRALGNQAVILIGKGRLKDAAALLTAEEKICRETGNLAGLQASLGNQALVKEKLADYEGAVELLEEKAKISRQLADPEKIARTLAQEAFLYAEKLHLPRYALPIAEAAYEIASKNGLTRLSQEIITLLDSIRSQHQ